MHYTSKISPTHFADLCLGDITTGGEDFAWNPLFSDRRAELLTVLETLDPKTKNSDLHVALKAARAIPFQDFVACLGLEAETRVLQPDQRVYKNAKWAHEHRNDWGKYYLLPNQPWQDEKGQYHYEFVIGRQAPRFFYYDAQFDRLMVGPEGQPEVSYYGYANQGRVFFLHEK